MNLEERRKEQLMKAHSYAIEIEHILTKILKIEGDSIKDDVEKIMLQISATDIESKPFLHIKCGLFYILAIHKDKIRGIIDYLAKYSVVEDMTTSDILSFVEGSREYNGSIFELDPENGEEYIKQMIGDFRKITE